MDGMGTRTRWVDQSGLISLVALLGLIGLVAGVTWLVVIFVLVATLFLHEMGHYVTARMTGMKVTEFFVGFGPRVWSFQRGETEYGIKAFWVGAYVRIAGMNNIDDVPPEEESRSFRSKSYPRKLLVLVAGSGVHFLLALIFLFVVLITYGPVAGVDDAPASESLDWSLASVSERSAAADAGLLPGDELVSVGGIESTTFAEFSRQISQLAGREVEVVYRRDGVENRVSTRVGERLTAQGAAGMAGLREGDRIIAVDGLVTDVDGLVTDVDGLVTDTPPTYAQIADYARLLGDTPVDIGVVDAGTGRPAVIEGAVINETVDPAVAVTGFFGVSAEYRRQPLGVVAASGESLRLFTVAVREVVTSMPKVVTVGLGSAFDSLFGSESDSSGTGAVADQEPRRLHSTNSVDNSDNENRVLSVYGVARIGAEMASEGATNVLLLLTLVNVFLGVFNLLPFPPLDGGHVAVATYERLRSVGGRHHQADASRLMPLTYAVALLLLLIGGVALVRDIIDPVNLG